MPVTFDNAAASITVGTSLGFNLTAGAGATLIVFTTSDGNNGSVSAIAYGGVALTKKTTRVGFFCECWVLSSAASGSHTLSAQFVNNLKWTMVGATYTKVKDVGTFGTDSTLTGTTVTNLNLSVSSTNTDLVVAFFAADQATGLSSGSGTTRLSSIQASSIGCILVDMPGGATVTISAVTTAASFWGAIGVPLVFSAGAATSATYKKALLGIGY